MGTYHIGLFAASIGQKQSSLIEYIDKPQLNCTWYGPVTIHVRGRNAGGKWCLCERVVMSYLCQSAVLIGQYYRVLK